MGVDERHVAASEECAPDLAVAAATKLIASGRASPADIDYVIHCTRGPDYFLPTTACVIQTASVCPGTAVRSTSIWVSGFKTENKRRAPDRLREIVPARETPDVCRNLNTRRLQSQAINKLAALLRDRQEQRNENERDRASGEQEVPGYMREPNSAPKTYPLL